jgi:hypothetical protein
MNGRVGQLRCRYQIAGDHGSIAPVSARLDHLARTRVPEALADALNATLGDDPAVYIVRHVTSRVVVNGNEATQDAHLARTWGTRLAHDVLKVLARDPNDGADVVRFEDNAEYVGSFLVDVLAGRAWDKWFYGHFSSLRALGTVALLRAVLEEHHEQLPGILQVVHRRGTLEHLLTVADDDVLDLLWRDRNSIDQDPEAARPVLLAVVRFVDQLGLWIEPRPDIAAVWATYVATAPLPTIWRDVRDLTATFVDVLRVLIERGHLRRPTDRKTLRNQLDHSVRELDWLDTTALRTSVEHLLAQPTPSESQLPVVTRNQATPRQRELLTDLADLLGGPGVCLAAGTLDTTANAVRLHTALVATSPRWQDDAMAKQQIERLLGVAQRVRQGDHRGAELKEEQAAIVKALADVNPDVDSMDTACAGAFLVLRAAFDAGVPAMVERVRYPPVEQVLLALALRWAGSSSVSGERIDRGLALLTGVDSIEELRAHWRQVPVEKHRRWKEALLSDHDSARKIEALRPGRLGLEDADATLGVTAIVLLRRWAQWLRGFSSSSTPFLLEQFIHRPGRIQRASDDLRVTLEPRPLDVVLNLAGYMDPVDLTPLWDRGHLLFEVVET